MKVISAVKFNSTKEFIEEMQLQKGKVLEKTVRVTHEYKRSSLSPNIYYVSVIATFIAQTEEGGYLLCRLDKFCGDQWSGLEADTNDKTTKQRDETTKAVSFEASALGLSVKAGVYEEASV